MTADEKKTLLEMLRTPGLSLRADVVDHFKQIARKAETREAMYGAAWMLAGLCERTGVSPFELAGVMSSIQLQAIAPMSGIIPKA